jgi:hypothetical protein
VGQIRKAGGTPPLVRDHADNYALHFTHAAHAQRPRRQLGEDGQPARADAAPTARSPTGGKPSTWETQRPRRQGGVETWTATPSSSTWSILAEATNKKLADDQGNPSPLFKLWWDKYGALPDAILLAAFGQALDRCRFFPSPAEFNEILDGVKRAAGVGDPRPEDETPTLLKKISRYNPDLGIVNDGTRGLIVAGRHNRGEDNPQSGFTARERHILRLFGGAARCAAWDDKDVQFNRPRMVEAFKQARRGHARRAAVPGDRGGRRLAGAGPAPAAAPGAAPAGGG